VSPPVGGVLFRYWLQAGVIAYVILRMAALARRTQHKGVSAQFVQCGNLSLRVLAPEEKIGGRLQRTFLVYVIGLFCARPLPTTEGDRLFWNSAHACKPIPALLLCGKFYSTPRKTCLRCCTRPEPCVNCADRGITDLQGIGNAFVLGRIFAEEHLHAARAVLTVPSAGRSPLLDSCRTWCCAVLFILARGLLIVSVTLRRVGFIAASKPWLARHARATSNASSLQVIVF